MPRISFDRAIASAMQQKPGDPPPAERASDQDQPGLVNTMLPAGVRRRLNRPLAMVHRLLGLGKRAARRLLGRPLRLMRRALLGPVPLHLTALQQIITGLHVKVDDLGKAVANIHPRQDLAAKTLAEIQQRMEALAEAQDTMRAGTDATLVAMRARIDDISIKVRGPIDLDSATWAVRTGDGYAAVPKSDTTLTTMLIDADVGGLEPGTRSLIRKLLPPGGTFVDIGAHIGLLTLAGARAVGPKGRVYAFEAAPDTFKLLERTVEINHVSPPVVMRSVAVGAEGGEHVFHVRNILGHSSLYDFADSDEGFTVADVTVQVMPLDGLLPGDERVDLVKIDVEGAELDVLAGMRELLERNPEIALLTEFGPSHLKRIGQTPESWFAAFAEHGLEAQLVDEETGACTPVSPKDVADVASVNVLFVAPYSRAAKIVA